MNPLSRVRFLFTSKRIGPDVFLTHFLLHSRTLGRWLAKRKLKAFGTGSSVRPYAYLIETKNISIGSNVVIRPGCMFFAVSQRDGRGDITIEDNVLIGSNVHIYVSNHAYSDPTIDIIDQGHEPPRPVVIKKGAWIGAGAIILPGVTIGERCVIGAGSVVTRSVPGGAVYAGVPAKLIKRMNSI